MNVWQLREQDPNVLSKSLSSMRWTTPTREQWRRAIRSSLLIFKSAIRRRWRSRARFLRPPILLTLRADCGGSSRELSRTDGLKLLCCLNFTCSHGVTNVAFKQFRRGDRDLKRENLIISGEAKMCRMKYSLFGLLTILLAVFAMSG